jgi:soluble lytic murein transglycosylase-like protein
MGSVRRRISRVLAAGMIGGCVIAHAETAVVRPASTLSSLDRWQNFIAEASRRFGIPEAWIRAVMQAESGGRTMLRERPITSPAGAMGLMQVMPETWAELRHRYYLGTNPFDPHDNILAGAAYLHELYERYGYPDLFAAYNAGPRRFDEHLFNGRLLPDETLAYLAAFGQPAFEPLRAPVGPTGTSLFFSLRSATNQVLNPPLAPSSGGLFVPLSTVPDRKP